MKPKFKKNEMVTIVNLHDAGEIYRECYLHAAVVNSVDEDIVYIRVFGIREDLGCYDWRLRSLGLDLKDWVFVYGNATRSLFELRSR